MEGRSEVEGVWVGRVGSVVGGFSVWGCGMCTSGCGDDGGLGWDSGGGGGGGDDGGGGGDGAEERYPDPGGDGEWCWALWPEDRTSSSGGTW